MKLRRGQYKSAQFVKKEKGLKFYGVCVHQEVHDREEKQPRPTCHMERSKQMRHYRRGRRRVVAGGAAAWLEKRRRLCPSRYSREVLLGGVSLALACARAIGLTGGGRRPCCVLRVALRQTELWVAGGGERRRRRSSAACG